MWGLYHIAEDERELAELISGHAEYLIAAINPKLYEKIQEKKDAMSIESTFFEEELQSKGISKETFDQLGNQETPAKYDEGVDVIGEPIVFER